MELIADRGWDTLKDFSRDEASGVYRGRRSKSLDDPRQFFAYLNSGGLSLDEALSTPDSPGCSILLTRFGHPKYVGERFARDKEEIFHVIEKSFRLGGRKHNLRKMLGQQLPPISDRAQLRTWNISALKNGFSSDAAEKIDSEYGGFLFQQSP